MWIFHDFPNAVVGEKEGASSKQVNSPYVGLTSLVRLNYIHVVYASTTSIKSYIYTCPLSKVHICGFLKTRHIEDVLLQVHIHFRLIWLGGTGWATRYIKIPKTPGPQFVDPSMDPDLLLFAGAFGPGVGNCLRVGHRSRGNSVYPHSGQSSCDCCRSYWRTAKRGLASCAVAVKQELLKRSDAE